MDEAGQATIPETAIPISLLKEGGCLVLAGDPRQLGPIINSPVAKQYGLDISLLERLIYLAGFLQKDVFQPDQENHSWGFQTFTSFLGDAFKNIFASSTSDVSVYQLLRNYRANPHIMHLYNKLFYESRLISLAHEVRVPVDRFATWSNLRRPGVPILFLNVNGKEEREWDSPSWFNSQEVTAVSQLISNLFANTDAVGAEIGVITPYRKQVQKLNNKLSSLRNENEEFSNIQVGTTEAFQGQEKNIIIISTVRSLRESVDTDIKFRIGFVSSPKRVNVAISRAKLLLIIVGDAMLLCSCDPLWQQLLILIEEMGAFRGPPLPRLTTNPLPHNIFNQIRQTQLGNEDDNNEDSYDTALEGSSGISEL